MGEVIEFQKVLSAPSFQAGAQNADFYLGKTDWLVIQRYVAAALALPIDADALRKAFKLGASEPVDSFDDLLAAYKDIYAHAKKWKDETFPNSVTLADDIVQYSRLVDTYYAGLLPHIATLKTNPNDGPARTALNAILDELIKDARTRADRAQGVYTEIKAFADATENDEKVIKALAAKYEKQYGTDSAEYKEIKAAMDAAQAEIVKFTNEYEFNVKVAATTPTYMWVSLIGTTIGVVIAAVYGTRATAALNSLRSAQATLATKDAALQRKMAVTTTNLVAKNHVSEIAGKMAGVLDIVRTIEGLWRAIARDLADLATTIRTKIKEINPNLMELGIQLAKKTWTDLGTMAHNYRLHAFIRIEGAPADTKAA